MMTNMTNLSTKISTAIIILSMIAVVGTTAASGPVQGQLAVEPQPENMTSSATNMTSLNITATGANTTTAVTNATAANATAGYFCYNCTNATAANATTTTNATSTNATTILPEVTGG
jgi:hypothetical protein